MAAERVIANSRKRRPTMPPIKRIGMKTATSEMLIEKTVNPISRAPCNAAANGRIPFSMWRAMFSMTTMASSTTKPLAMLSAMSERLSMLKPNRYITANVPMSDTGTATAGISVARALLRKIKTTATTRQIERINVISTSRTEARIVVVRSRTTLNCMP